MAILLRRGYIPPAITNLLSASESFDSGANWPDATGTTITANSTLAPNNQTVADSLVEDGTNGNHLRGHVEAAIAVGTLFTYSCYVKPSTRTQVRLQLYATGFAANVTGDFDLNSVSFLGGGGNAGGLFVQGSLAAAQNGFYRCQVSGVLDRTSSTQLAYIFAMSSGSLSYAGSNGSTALILWGAQLEVGMPAKQYVGTPP